MKKDDAYKRAARECKRKRAIVREESQPSADEPSIG